VAPHTEAAAAEHADFDQMNVPVTEALQVAFVDREIVPPLEDPQPFDVGVKVPFKLTRRLRGTVARRVERVPESLTPTYAPPTAQLIGSPSRPAPHAG
jgi:hypothetical protein